MRFLKLANQFGLRNLYGIILTSIPGSEGARTTLEGFHLQENLIPH